MAFPDSANRCCRHQAQLERQLQFQRAFCLSDSYQECSIFQQEGDPKNSETEAAETAGKSSRLKMALPLIIILITFITFVSLSAMGIDLFATLSAFAPR